MGAGEHPAARLGISVQHLGIERLHQRLDLGIVQLSDIELSTAGCGDPPDLGRGQTLLLPGTHPIRRLFEEVGYAYRCLYSGSPHIVADGVAHMDKGNSNTGLLQLLDETKQFISCAEVDEVDGSTIQEHALYMGPRGKRCLQDRAHMADTREEQVAAYPPDQQSGKRGGLRVTLDVAISFNAWQLTKLRPFGWLVR